MRRQQARRQDRRKDDLPREDAFDRRTPSENRLEERDRRERKDATTSPKNRTAARSTADISPGMYSVYTFGIAPWGVYRVLLDSWPIILTNALTFLFAGSVLVMKVGLG